MFSFPEEPKLRIDCGYSEYDFLPRRILETQLTAMEIGRKSHEASWLGYKTELKKRTDRDTNLKIQHGLLQSSDAESGHACGV